MSKVKIKNLNQVRSSVRKIITQAARDKDVRSEIGEVVINEIKDNPLGTAAKSTQKWRARYEKLNITDPKYSRFKINATFTGELLEDLRKNIRLRSVTGIIQYIIQHSSKKHKAYNGVRGRFGGGSEYTTIQKGLEDNGYDYLSLKSSSIARISQSIKEIIRKKIISVSG